MSRRYDVFLTNLLYRHIIPASFEPRRITTRRRVFAADAATVNSLHNFSLRLGAEQPGRLVVDPAVTILVFATSTLTRETNLIVPPRGRCLV